MFVAVYWIFVIKMLWNETYSALYLFLCIIFFLEMSRVFGVYRYLFSVQIVGVTFVIVIVLFVSRTIHDQYNGIALLFMFLLLSSQFRTRYSVYGCVNQRYINAHRHVQMMRMPFFLSPSFPSFPCYWIVVFFWECDTIVKIAQSRVIYSQTIIIFTSEYWNRRYSSILKSISSTYLIKKNRLINFLLSVCRFFHDICIVQRLLQFIIIYVFRFYINRSAHTNIYI